MKGSLKVDIDGSFMAGSLEGAISCICKHDHGRLVDGFARSIKVNSAELVEARALVETLDFLVAQRGQKIYLESDNLSLVQTLKGANHFPWEAHQVITEAKSKLLGFVDLSLEYCSREGNRAADCQSLRPSLSSLVVPVPHFQQHPHPMADEAELAVSLAKASLLDLLSKSQKIIIPHQNFTRQIRDSINSLQSIMNKMRQQAFHNHEPFPDNATLLVRARDAEKAAQHLLVQLLRHYVSKSQLGRFFSAADRVRARKNMATQFRDGVVSPFQQLDANWPAAAENGQQDSGMAYQGNMRVESDIVGRDQSVTLLVTNLIPPADRNAPPPPPDSLHVIAVVGRRNCGKTALVRSVFNNLEVKHHFDCCAWVRVADVGPESWTESLLVDILLQMPFQDQLKDLKHKNKEQLIRMLRQLLMEKRYLIVLDNLGARRFTDFWDPFEDSNGSRIIVTSTEEAMQNLVDPGVDDLQLCPDFTEEECMALLQDSFTGGGVLPPELMTLILRKCGGSAPAISLLGGLLSAVEENRREALVAPLGESAPLNHFLSLSFNELPIEMKPCVLYMALFPKESEVPTRRLFRLWAAEGLLLAEPAADGLVRMRSAEDCFHELERRNLIRVVRRKPDTSARSCRMPAFLHDFFCQMAIDFRLLKISPDAEQNAPNQPNQAQNTATGHHDYIVQYLRSVASFQTCKPGTEQGREIKDLLKPPIIDEGPVLLRVLDLEGVYKPVLPKKFEDILPNLRYLGLRRTALDSIPESVGNLLLLETLDLKHTNITKVTSAIWNAKNLRHLYLSEASFDGPIPGHVSTGSKLETLWGLFIETDRSPMINVLPRLQSLTKLGVTCRPGAVMVVAGCILRLTRLKSLRLRSRDLFSQPAVLRFGDNMTGLRDLLDLSNLYLLGSLRPAQNPCSVLPLSLKRLTLSMSGCRDDPMQVLQHLNQLIELRLLGRSCSTRQLHCQAGFPQLRVLKLWMLDNLEEFAIDQGAMVNLEELDISQCEKLGRVSGLDQINNRLTSLRLTKVKKVLDPNGPAHDPPAPDVRIRVRRPGTWVKTTELLRQEKYDGTFWRAEAYECRL
ncbi:probable disease resistance protein RF9 [Rhodamnia argentea]|uniref:Probable disease resistance protein RF9 n=1 Tax=Rhodamnia argentea TaxID=178133 RepID=A0ABM3HSM7_9MYRT|nr:probable disease resistance protein RF9 [Rhodamnia argentea]